MSELIPIERIENKILFIRGQKIILDRDLALLYEVETKSLKRQVRRNIERFPDDFMFELTKEEFENWRCQFGTSNDIMGLRYKPMAFTEHGIAMLSSVINSKQAIQVNIKIMRTFTEMRKMLMDNSKMNKKLEDIEDRIDTQEMNTILLMDKVRNLTSTSIQEKRKIGFETNEQ